MCRGKVFLSCVPLISLVLSLLRRFHSNVDAFNARIVGLPVLIEDEKYDRNFFLFNVSLLIDDKADSTVALEAVARRTARVLRDLELERGFLSSLDNVSEVAVLCARLYRALNGEVWFPWLAGAGNRLGGVRGSASK